MSLLYDWEWDLGVDWVVGDVVESGVVRRGFDLGVGLGRVDRASLREPCLFMLFLLKVVRSDGVFLDLPEVGGRDREGGGGGVARALAG